MLRALAFTACIFTSSSVAAQSTEFGEWIELFNGQNIDGWVAAKPGEDNPRQQQNVWKAEDGTLTNGGPKKNDLCTVDSFQDYELEIEYKIPPRGNSGVYLRGQIEVQIYDSADKSDQDLSEADAGALYGAGKALRSTQYPPGHWNKYRVLHIGHRITVWHNGILIQDNRYAPDKTGGAMPRDGEREDHPQVTVTANEGPIMLQGDHGHVWYRNVRVRPLFTAGSGWRSIWNGKTLDAFWTKEGHDINNLWAVKDHAFTNVGFGSNGADIWTKEEFGNFLAYYSYKSNPEADGGNSGFYLRNQWEIQIHSQNSTSNKHGDGALYSLYPPLVAARHEPHQWNHVWVKMEGVRIWVWQNGQLIHNGRVCATRTDNHKTPTPGFSKGPFKLQGDHGEVAFSQLWIKPLPDVQSGD